MGTLQAAEAMARFLEQHGVELVVGQSLPSALHLALPKTGIRQIQVRTENAGTAICDAYARIAGKVAIITAQNGPAATLLVPGLAEALKASVPVVAIVQEVNADQRDRNAFQECDHFALFAGCAKWVGRVETAARIYDYLNLALTQALTGRPGPAVLLVPAEVLQQPAPPLPGIVAPRSTYPLDRVSADPASIAAAAELLAAAERPLIVAGGGVHGSRACAQIAVLQQEFGIPVATTLMGKGAIDEARPLSLGVVGHVLGARAPNRLSRNYLERADVVLLVGTRTNQNGTDSWSLFRADARFIHLDIDGVEVGRNYESFRLVGDARTTLDALIADLRARFCAGQGADQAKRVQRLIAPRRMLDDCIPAGQPGTVRPERIVDALNRLAPENSILVADASYSSVWLGAFGLARHTGSRFLTPRGLAGLGWGLPYMLGAKLARPSATVIGLCGDGGFAHVWSELETAARSDLAFVCIVLKNGVLGYQRDAELVKFGAHTNAIPIAEIDHAAIARACGCVGLSVEAPEELDGALAEALSLDRPVVLDVRTDPSAFPPVTLLDSLVSEPATAEA